MTMTGITENGPARTTEAGARLRTVARTARRAGARLIRIVILAAVLGATAVAAGSPLWVKHDLGSAARAAANAGAQAMAATKNLEQAQAAAAAAAVQHHAHLDSFVLGTGTVRVTVARHAPTLLLDQAFPSWYDVRVHASAAPH